MYILLPLLLLPQMLLGGLMIAFDDLHSHRAPNAYPPWIGEWTASRWAFEALAVEQYQSNAYQRHFEAVDRELSARDYLVHDWIPAVQGRLDALYLAAPARREDIRQLLIREFRRLSGTTICSRVGPAISWDELKTYADRKDLLTRIYDAVFSMAPRRVGGLRKAG